MSNTNKPVSTTGKNFLEKELLERNDGERLDGGTAETTIREDQKMEALGTGNRADDAKRETWKFDERRQRYGMVRDSKLAENAFKPTPIQRTRIALNRRLESLDGRIPVGSLRKFVAKRIAHSKVRQTVYCATDSAVGTMRVT
jgi:hypothetical protein